MFLLFMKISKIDELEMLLEMVSLHLKMDNFALISEANQNLSRAIIDY